MRFASPIGRLASAISRMQPDGNPRKTRIVILGVALGLMFFYGAMLAKKSGRENIKHSLDQWVAEL